MTLRTLALALSATLFLAGCQTAPNRDVQAQLEAQQRQIDALKRQPRPQPKEEKAEASHHQVAQFAAMCSMHFYRMTTVDNLTSSVRMRLHTAYKGALWMAMKQGALAVEEHTGHTPTFEEAKAVLEKYIDQAIDRHNGMTKEERLKTYKLCVEVHKEFAAEDPSDKTSF